MPKKEEPELYILITADKEYVLTSTNDISEALSEFLYTSRQPISNIISPFHWVTFSHFMESIDNYFRFSSFEVTY
jgi:hypothetical protein